MEPAVEVTDCVLTAELAEKRDSLLRDWLARTLRTYPESMTRFLSREQDPFRNPVGHTLKEGLPTLFDQLVRTPDGAVVTRVLDGIVRMRAVQDFSASQAVGFLFLLKQVLRDQLKSAAARCPDEMAALERKIDEMALLAFDLFMKCRQQIYEIQANEARRRVSILEKVSRVGCSEPSS